MNKSNAETEDSSWNWIYKIGGVAALIAVLIFLLDIVLTFGGGNIRYGTLTAIDMFKLFQGNWLVGLRYLGFMNIISWTVSIPLFFALYAAHRRVFKPYAALALILYLVGVAVYISNNAAIPIFVLSVKYAAATTDAQRTLLAAAGEAILARGEDFTPSSFYGLFVTGIIGIVFSFIMLRGRIFSKTTAYTGILGFLLLSIYIIWATFVPVFYDMAMIFGIVGGILSTLWYILVARRLFQLGKGVSKREGEWELTNQATSNIKVSNLNSMVSRIGFWSAILTVVITTVFFIAGILTPARSGPIANAPIIPYPYTTGIASFIPMDYLWLYPGILLAPTFVVLMACIHYYASDDKKIFSHIGLSFALIYAAVIITDYFIQFTVVIPSILNGETAGLSLITQYNPHGIFIALEATGYLMMSVAFLFAAAVFAGGRLESAIRWLFVLSFVLAIGSFVIFSLLSYDIVAFEVTILTINWIVLIVSGILLSILFKRAGQDILKEEVN